MYYFDEIKKRSNKICPLELYKYSLFFRNYIENAVEDTLKNGIYLESLDNISESEIARLKRELKDALLSLIISYRFNGAGYILVNTRDELTELEEEVNSELPIGFKYLDFDLIKDLGIYDQHITYTVKEGNTSYSLVKIHKSRVIIFDNYDYVLKRYTPCYSESFLLNVYLLEKIYLEIEKRIETHNFLFYKDEALFGLQDALSSATASLNSLTHKSNKGLFSYLFQRQRQDNNSISDLKSVNDSLSREIERLKSSLNNEGMFYTATSNATLEVIKYDLSYLKEALALVKAKIGADTKEPLTRSFNEQTKGLGNDGKGDRSNYYDFLKGIQEAVEIAVNIKLSRYFGLEMKFNSLVVLNEEEKVERDLKLLEFFGKYSELISKKVLSKDEISKLKEKLFSI
ncbi:anti-CBASS protein Acb1 family protein [Borrelia venezuelensis]|uniref:anti-CBASS protein Acb1 family protein n=1 Tax=Borrelia venezuelensis TaxID=1653839 RepID=UPI001FF4D963|nr:anti-CBASS Acb1 family protein [Borrelia venezuelensis]UPA12576.1 DUF1073 domain-containing protein [Borrelia venezuelensis]